MSDPMTDLLVSTIEEMIVRSARRYVEARQLINDIPRNIRREASKEIAAQKRSIDRLARFRASLTTNRTPGNQPPAVTNSLSAVAVTACTPSPRTRKRSIASTTKTMASKPSPTTLLSA
jgi:hypothetical protein